MVLLLAAKDEWITVQCSASGEHMQRWSDTFDRIATFVEPI